MMLKWCKWRQNDKCRKLKQYTKAYNTYDVSSFGHSPKYVSQFNLQYLWGKHSVIPLLFSDLDCDESGFVAH